MGFLLLLLGCLSISTQSHRDTGLSKNSFSGNADTSQVRRLLDQAKSYLNTNPDTAMALARRCSTYAGRINYPNGIAHSLYIMGDAYYRRGNYLQAIEHNHQSLQIAEKQGDKKLAADNLNSIGTSYHTQNNYTKALEYYFQALRRREELQDWPGVAASLDNIGLVHTQQGSYERARNYHAKALAIEEKRPNKQDIAITLTNIAITHQFQKDYETALKIFFQVRKTFEAVHDQYGMRVALQSIAQIYLAQGKYAQALTYSNQALHISEQLQDKEGVAQNQTLMAEIYQKSDQLDQSQAYALKSLELAQRIGVKNLVMESSRILAGNYQQQQNFEKALHYHQIASAMQDSIFSVEKVKAISNLQANYELEKKELEIKALQQERMAQEQKLANQTLQRNGLVIGFILLIGLGFMIMRNIKQQHKISELRAQKALADIIHLSSHKVRGPIASILGLTQIYNWAQPEDPFNAEVMDHIVKSAQKLDEIVHDAVFTAHEQIKN